MTILEEFVSTRNAGIWLPTEFPNWRYRDWMKRPHKYVQVQDYIMTDQRYTQYQLFAASRGQAPLPPENVLPPEYEGKGGQSGGRWAHPDPNWNAGTQYYGGYSSGGSNGGSAPAPMDPNLVYLGLAVAAILILRK